MKIRNVTNERRVIPSLHVEAEPGGIVTVPAGTQVPTGWQEVKTEKKKVEKPSAPAATLPAE